MLLICLFIYFERFAGTENELCVGRRRGGLDQNRGRGSGCWDRRQQGRIPYQVFSKRGVGCVSDGEKRVVEL